MASKSSFDAFGPSAFTPFLRRFTDEKAKDLRDTELLYERVRGLHLASRFRGDDGETALGGTVWGGCASSVSSELESTFIHTIHHLLRLERPIFELPNIELRGAHLSLKELVDLRHFLRAKEYFHLHETKVTHLLTDCLYRIFSTVAELLPATFAPSPFTIPLVFLLPEPKSLIERLYGELWNERYVDNGLFVEVSRRMYLNLCEVSGIVDPHNPKRKFKTATSNDAPLQDVVEQYLKGTPFRDFFLAPAPLQFRHEERFSHMHVVGGSGAGKTTLLENLILNDLESDDPPSLVIVDSQSDLIRKLSRLWLFDPYDGRLGDRLLVISPRDIRHPPALNIFDVNRNRLGAYDEATKEQVVAGVIQTFDYLFTGLLGADLTAKQGVFFRFVARLMLALPERLGRSATILDMLNLMDDVTPYREAIQTLPPIQRQFFERDFASKTFAQTKEQIRYRLNAVLENPTLARLFTTPSTKIDLFAELNRGSVVLVDTAKDFLKGASANFGRIFISLVLQAILERAAIPERERKPTFLIVDEAAAYFDSNIDDLLTEARKYKLGCVFAHQFLDQASASLRSSLAANTSIKMAAGVSMGDARSLAPDMRTQPEFILSQPRLHFAAHIRNVTPSAVSIPVEVGRLERQPRLSDDALDELWSRNRSRVALLPDRPAALPGPDVASTVGEAQATHVDSAVGAHLSDPTAPSEEW
jgi:hypothetical protein